MGNKLYVDARVSKIEDIINLNLDLLKNVKIESEETGFQLMKVWRFWENEDDIIKSEAILLPKIREDHFLLSSLEIYIILVIYKGKDDISDISAFPTNLWGIVESSSNMTPRGLKYAFSASSYKSENLESYLLSKRDFKNSDFKYLLFIWNGKNCSPLLKSTVLMKGFDLDKKLVNPEIIPYLYYGHSIKDKLIQKGKIVKLNEIISNTYETVTDENVNIPSSETFYNYQETVYLLHWLYPFDNKKVERKCNRKSHKHLLFKKFNTTFLKDINVRRYNDLFMRIDQNSQDLIKNEKEKLNIKNIDSNDSLEEDFQEDELEIQDNEDINKDNYLYESEFHDSINCDDEVDLVDGMVNNREAAILLNKEANSIKKLNFTKINIGDVYHKNNISTDTDKNSSHLKDLRVPKLNLKFQQKYLNEDLILKKSKQISEDEEKLDSLATYTIRKASNIILKDPLLKKLDIIGLDKKYCSNAHPIQTPNFNINLKISENVENDAKMIPDDEHDDHLNYGFKENDRKKVVMDYFSKTLSEIIDGFLYLSSYNVAKNKEIVLRNNITHIINAAADVCQNHFENDIKYLSFNLKDHAMEVKKLLIE